MMSSSRADDQEKEASNPFAGGFTFATKTARADANNAGAAPSNPLDESPFRNIHFQQKDNSSNRSPRRRNSGETAFLPSARLPKTYRCAPRMEVPSIFLDDSENEQQGSSENAVGEFEPTVGKVLKGHVSQDMLLAALQNIAKDITVHAKY